MRIILSALLLAAAPLAAAPAELVAIKVNGLVCDFCARAIEATMKRRKEVERVHVDLDRGEIRLVLRAGSALADPEIRKLVTDSGYTVTAIAREPRP